MGEPMVHGRQSVTDLDGRCCEHAQGKDAENPWCGACAAIPSWKTRAMRMRNPCQGLRVYARDCVHYLILNSIYRYP